VCSSDLICGWLGFGLITPLLIAVGTGRAADGFSSGTPSPWPAMTRECRPGVYWWWMGSAVDTTNITRELERYHAAGVGAAHIIPIYGAKGWEDRFIPYLSAPWMNMLRHAASEARRLDMNLDMTTGSGWCFGGPHVTDREANASVVAKTAKVEAGRGRYTPFRKSPPARR
jgi:hypothetical protein